ncbi:hypothetical protein HHI36_017876 [Cryptolaemus montrouzieri]|uniref:Uncharacterized protein n=1 Tax=Cryptolaemus montrouzieri TaxID=559131 RepID=A0ABD2NPU4_9CUCU
MQSKVVFACLILSALLVLAVTGHPESSNNDEVLQEVGKKIGDQLDQTIGQMENLLEGSMKAEMSRDVDKAESGQK